MAFLPLSLNSEYFNDDTTGKPVFYGSVWIGKPDFDPEIEANRVDVIITQEDGTNVTIDASMQPLITGVNGRIQFAGKTVVVKVDGACSVKVRNRADKQVYYAPRSNEADTTPTDTGVNLANGSFEFETVTGLSDSWLFASFVNGSVAPDSTSQAHGLKSLKIIGVDANGGGIATSDRFNTAENTDIDVRFTYKASNAATLNKIEFKFYNAAGAPVSTVTAYSNGTTNPLTYTPYLRRITVPSGGIEAELIITGLDPLGTVKVGNANFDGIQWEEADPVIDSINVDNAVNKVAISDAVTTVNPVLRSDGEANTGLILADSNDNEIIIAESVADAVNEITVTNAITGNRPTISASGEADVGIDFENDQGEEMLELVATPSAVNNVRITNDTTGNAAIIDCSETNGDLEFTRNGTGDITVNAVPIYGFVVLDTPELIAGTTLTHDSWTTVNSTTLGAASAVKALIRVGIIASKNTLSISANFYLRKTGSGLSNTGITRVVNNTESASSSINLNANIATEATINLDGNSDFDYYYNTTATLSGDTSGIYLIGYYV